MPDSSTLTPASRAASAHEHGVDRGRVADRLVEDVDHPRQHVDDVRADLDLVQRDAEVRGHHAGVARVVRHGLEALVLGPERDRVGLDRGVAAAGDRGDEAGVQAAAEERRHRARRPRGAPRPTPRDRRQVGRAAAPRPRRPPRAGPSTGARPVACRPARTASTSPGGSLTDARRTRDVLGQPVVQRGGDQRRAGRPRARGRPPRRSP